MGIVRTIRYQIAAGQLKVSEAGLPPLSAHYVTPEDREALMRDLGRIDRSVPPHIARTMKKLEVDGVEVRAIEVLGPEEDE